MKRKNPVTQITREAVTAAILAGMIAFSAGTCAAYCRDGSPAEPKSGQARISIEAVEDMPALDVQKLIVRKYYDVPLSDELQDHIALTCEKYHIDPAIVTAMIWKESTYRSHLLGDSGKSYGLMQVQKRWHGERMKSLGVTDLFDPFGNVTVGVDILAGHIKAYDGNVEMALVAYNMGTTGARKNCFSKGVYSSKYSRAVLAKAEELRKDVEIVFYTDDPVKDFENYDRDQARKLSELPVCMDCDEPIQDSTCYEFNGEYICESCLKTYHQKDVGDCV